MEGRGKERERNVNVWLPVVCPNWGPGPQPRHVPWLGIEPVTLWFTGWCSIHWATPARALTLTSLLPTVISPNRGLLGVSPHLCLPSCLPCNPNKPFHPPPAGPTQGSISILEGRGLVFKALTPSKCSEWSIYKINISFYQKKTLGVIENVSKDEDEVASCS